MAELVDPKKLKSVAQLAIEYGFDRKYLSRLASTGKLKAWFIADSWITTDEILTQYLKTRPSRGRPKKNKQKSPQK
jgi:hypothetical protein